MDIEVTKPLLPARGHVSERQFRQEHQLPDNNKLWRGTGLTGNPHIAYVHDAEVSN